MIKDAEKSRPKQKSSEPEAKKKQEGKTVGKYFELPRLL